MIIQLDNRKDTLLCRTCKKKETFFGTFLHFLFRRHHEESFFRPLNRTLSLCIEGIYVGKNQNKFCFSLT